MLKRSFSQKVKNPRRRAKQQKSRMQPSFRKTGNPPLDSEDRFLHQYCLKVVYYVFFQAVTQLDIGNQGKGT